MDTPQKDNLVTIDLSKSLEIENATITAYRRIDNLEKQTQYLYVVITGITVALLLGFAALLFTFGGVLTDLWRQNVDSYIDYKDSEKKNSEAVEKLNEQLNQMKQRLDVLQPPK